MGDAIAFMASRMAELGGTRIVDAEIDGDGHLILTQGDSTEVDGGDLANLAQYDDPMASLESRLATLEFPAGDNVWRYVGTAGNPPFTTGGNSGGVNTDVRFRKENGRVFLDGTMTLSSTTTAQNLFTLPSGFRPASSHIFSGSGNMVSGPASGGTAHTHVLTAFSVRITIDTAGVVSTTGPGLFQAASYVSLSRISFRVD